MANLVNAHAGDVPWEILLVFRPPVHNFNKADRQIHSNENFIKELCWMLILGWAFNYILGTHIGLQTYYSTNWDSESIWLLIWPLTMSLATNKQTYVWTKEPFFLDKDDEKWFEGCGQEFGIKSSMEPIHMYRMISNFIGFQNTGQCSFLKCIILVSAVWDFRGSKLWPGWLLLPIGSRSYEQRGASDEG